MKTPNRIYVPKLIYETWQYQTPDPNDETQVEYICKDTLLEWAKRELENAKITDFDEFGRGEVTTWEQVIDKINLL